MDVWYIAAPYWNRAFGHGWIDAEVSWTRDGQTLIAQGRVTALFKEPELPAGAKWELDASLDRPDARHGGIFHPMRITMSHFDEATACDVVDLTTGTTRALDNPVPSGSSSFSQSWSGGEIVTVGFAEPWLVPISGVSAAPRHFLIPGG
jgi:hypothetical protein